MDRDISNLKFRRIALARESRVRITLRDVKALLGVLDLEVAHRHVPEVAQAAAAAVGRHALRHAGPGLDVRAVFVVVGVDVADGDVFEDFEFAVELPDAAVGDAGGFVEGAVFDEDVGAVCEGCVSRCQEEWA